MNIHFQEKYLLDDLNCVIAKSNKKQKYIQYQQQCRLLLMTYIALHCPRCLFILDKCFEYYRNWLFCFNENISSIIQFSMNTRESNVNFHIVLEIVIFHYLNTTHICSIELSSCFKLNHRTINAHRKGINAYFALKRVVSRVNNLSVLIKLFKVVVVVLPSVLYGCEAWSNLKSCDITTLNFFNNRLYSIIL